MTREQILERLAENSVWLLQMRAERERLEDQILSLVLVNDDLREQLANFKPTLRVVA